MLQSKATRQIEEYFISTYKYIHSLSNAVVTFWKVFCKSSFMQVKLSMHRVNCICVCVCVCVCIYTYICHYTEMVIGERK